MYLFKENYFNTRKDEIMTEKIIKRLTDFCIYLIKEIAKGDTEKEKQLNKQMIKMVIEYRENEDIKKEQTNEK